MSVSRGTVRLEFLGCKLTAYGGPDGKGIRVWLEVSCFAEFLRDIAGNCAFCHGDPVAERPCRECGGGYVERVPAPPEQRPRRASFVHRPHAEGCSTVTWIDREFMAAPDNRFETCPCCQGRPT